MEVFRMRSTFIVSLILLVSAWAFAQQNTPSAPDQSQAPGQSQMQSQPGTTPDQANSPAAPSASEAAAPDVVEGCLGGSNPNFTVTDKTGSTYQILIPQGANAAPLGQHIGESVKVMGAIDKSSSKSAAGSTGSVAGAENGSSSSSAGASKAIHAMRITRGTTTCSASGSAAPKPPSK
jgi:uncharacterized protein YdeI (BOF family)